MPHHQIINFNNENFSKVLDGTKCQTLRLGERKYTLGEAYAKCENLSSCALVTITEIERIKFGQITESMAVLDGFSSLEQLKDALRSIYHDQFISPEHVMTLIKFELTSKNSHELYEAKKQKSLHAIRDAIQQAEEFGLVRTESGEVITGAVMTEHGIMLTKD